MATIMLDLGPVVVTSGATLELAVHRAPAQVQVQVPDTPAKQGQAIAWLAGMATFGDYVGQHVTGTKLGGVVGALVAVRWASHKWNRWSSS